MNSLSLVDGAVVVVFVVRRFHRHRFLEVCFTHLLEPFKRVSLAQREHTYKTQTLNPSFVTEPFLLISHGNTATIQTIN